MHEGHAFRHDGERDKIVAQERAQIVDKIMVDFVDAQRKAMDTPFGRQFALQSLDLFNKVVEPFQECGVCGLLRPDAGDGFAWKPAAFIIGVKNLEISAFDLDDQAPLVGKLKLVSVILRSAVDKIADVDWSGLQPY